MPVDVTADLESVDFAPASEETEIIQNVKTILSTLKKTVPMDREFGINGEIIDLPVATTQARLTAEIVAAVNKYEPRAQVVSVSYEGDAGEGEVRVRARVKINGA